MNAVLKLDFAHGTDSGPACASCAGTVYAYALRGHAVQARNATSRCMGCNALDYFRATEDEEITAVTLREAHERHALGRAGKSRGHICFAFGGQVEFYEQGGLVYRAPTHNAFDIWGRRHGRFECTRKLFDRNRDLILGGVL